MKYGLIGEKLGHSFSKEIHEQIRDYKYEICEVSRDQFDKFMQEKGFKAINVTIPYKEKVIPYLDYIDPTTKMIGAVNTIVNNDGKLYGYNTDYFGLKSLIEKNNIDVTNKKALILGTGGTSKTATLVLKLKGVKEIYYASINHEVNTYTYEEIVKIHNDANIIVNTTPCGMYPNNDGLIIDLDLFPHLEAVIDVVYNPMLTRLLQKAKKKNLKYAGGLYMLVAQAVYASSLFLNLETNTNIIDDIYAKLYKEKQNIILIGMPTCGKSTIGKIISQKLNKEFVDTDSLIEKEIKMVIKDFLRKDNEQEFRDIEEKVIKEIAKKQNQVISCGGGVIKRPENIERLKQNGIVIFIDRDITLLKASDKRPLSTDLESLKKLYEERYPIYLESSDIIITNNTDDYQDAAEKIINEV